MPALSGRRVGNTSNEAEPIMTFNPKELADQQGRLGPDFDGLRREIDQQNVWMPLARILPQHRAEIGRLKAAIYLDAGEPVRVAAVGKFSHGKTTLLNALGGRPIFPTGEMHTTLEVLRQVTADAVWIDTPGLDAGVISANDRRAPAAVLREADVVLFVHDAGAGVLDRDGLSYIESLRDLDPSWAPRVLLALACRDAVGQDERERIAREISQQVPGLPVFPVAFEPVCRAAEEGRPAFAPGTVPDGGLAALKEAVFRDANGVIRRRAVSVAAIRHSLVIALQMKKTGDILGQAELFLHEVEQGCTLESELFGVYARFVTRQG